jgi:DNA-binding XRE family transcriptional regulator
MESLVGGGFMKRKKSKKYPKVDTYWAEFVIQLRCLLDLTQEELGKEIGNVCDDTISKWEKNERRPSRRRKYQLYLKGKEKGLKIDPSHP